MDLYTDVEGFSHKSGEEFDSFHAQNPTRPKFASECCSCSSNRSPQFRSSSPAGLLDEQVDLSGESCTAEQSNRSNARPFMAGTMVWTLFDYYGESHGWPKVSSAYGQFDLAGFQKTTARWYRTFWLSAVPVSDASRPVGFGAAHSCYPYHGRGGVQVLTEATTVDLYEDGKKMSTVHVDPSQLTAASFPKMDPESPDAINTTVVCSDSAGTVLASGTMMQPGNATAIMLSIDAPSVATGTGTHLLLDGHDVAMLRATVVDDNGYTVGTSSANISFTVGAGPGRVIATANGDNACHEPNHAPWHSAFNGLARAFVQVTEHHTGSVAERARLAAIDTEIAHTTVVHHPSQTTADKAPRSITVVASSAGLKSATVEIPVSVESAVHGVLPVAARSVQQRKLQHWD